MLRIWSEINSFVEVTCEICGKLETTQYSNIDLSSYEDIDFLEGEKDIFEYDFDNFEYDFDNFVVLPNNLIVCKKCYQEHILNLINEKKKYLKGE